MWIDTRDSVPLADGRYMVQTVYGKVGTMLYTHEYGWNTFISKYGKVNNDKSIDNLYVVRWFLVPPPAAVPAEWFTEYWADVERREKWNTR